jgi:hypothetical protein
MRTVLLIFDNSIQTFKLNAAKQKTSDSLKLIKNNKRIFFSI